MENADLIEQTIERLKSDGIDNLNKWITTCTRGRSLPSAGI